MAQLYRDRATGENNFDELKNHWGWGGFTTRDLPRCRLMARIVALTTTAGRCSCGWPGWPTRISTPRRSPVGRCCCTA